MISLIANSDDFGLNQSITDAIIETHLNGIMTSTTIMVNMPGFEYAVKRGKEIDTLGIGIHFNLTEGKPVSDPDKVSALLDDEGNFLSNEQQRKNLILGKNTLEAAKIELDNQLIKLLDHGIIPTHFDSHHHITGTPIGLRSAIQVAKKHNVNKARVTSVDFHFKMDYRNRMKYLFPIIKSIPKSLVHTYNKLSLHNNGFITPRTKVIPNRVIPVSQDKVLHFIEVLRILKPGVTEISFHPGYVDSNLVDKPSTAKLRVSDFKVSTSSLVKDFIRTNGIQLINFREVR